MARITRGVINFCAILHFVQDDRMIGGVMHGVILKWNEKK